MPVIDAIAADYQDRVRFLAVAGRGTSPEGAAQKASGDWFDGSRISWTIDDDVWALYEIYDQPWSVLITGDDFVAEQWIRARPDAATREALDRLLEVSG